MSGQRSLGYISGRLVNETNVTAKPDEIIGIYRRHAKVWASDRGSGLCSIGSLPFCGGWIRVTPLSEVTNVKPLDLSNKAF